MGGAVPEKTALITDVRSLKEFVSAVLENPKAASLRLGTIDPETRKFTVSDNPGFAEVLQKMNYTPVDRERLANALFQQTVATRAGNEAVGKGAVVNQMDGGETRVGKIGRNEKLEGKPVQQQLREIRGDVDPETRTPFIGVPEGSTGRSQMKRQMYQGLDATQVRPNLQRRDIKQGKGIPVACVQDSRDLLQIANMRKQLQNNVVHR